VTMLSQSHAPPPKTAKPNIAPATISADTGMGASMMIPLNAQLPDGSCFSV